MLMMFGWLMKFDNEGDNVQVIYDSKVIEISWMIVGCLRVREKVFETLKIER